MEQIAKLLFAATVVTIFMYVLVFTSIVQSGNGGEYWGFNGLEEPWRAAARSFDKGDYRFLEVNLVGPDGVPVRVAPMYQRCDNHPFGAHNSLRPSSVDPLHGIDSVRVATDFARQFNENMTYQLFEMMDRRCEEWVYE